MYRVAARLLPASPDTLFAGNDLRTRENRWPGRVNKPSKYRYSAGYMIRSRDTSSSNTMFVVQPSVSEDTPRGGLAICSKIFKRSTLFLIVFQIYSQYNVVGILPRNVNCVR